MKDLLPNIVNQKDEKPHTAGLDDSAILHIKNKITEIPLKKKPNTITLHVSLLYLISSETTYASHFFPVQFAAVTPQATTFYWP